jgi:hypothetical protein
VVLKRKYWDLSNRLTPKMPVLIPAVTSESTGIFMDT